MIFALMGSNPYPFDRFSDCLSRLAVETGHHIIVQIGKNEAVKGCECFEFAPRAHVLELIQKADVIIMQGGYGGCLDALNAGKIPIVMPRRVELFESNDDQTELVDFLAGNKLVVKINAYEDLIDALKYIQETEGSGQIQVPNIGYDLAYYIIDFLEV
jgi:UDP-N-acetylglucosamine--N-acetylmuramyl-(pentapeptide) pyrophosphoryl-undecaprenol N-acetylglucosamine transferase